MGSSASRWFGHVCETRHQEVGCGADDLSPRDIRMRLPPERQPVGHAHHTLGEQLVALARPWAAQCGATRDLARDPDTCLGEDAVMLAGDLGIAGRLAKQHPPGIRMAFDIGKERLEPLLGCGSRARHRKQLVAFVCEQLEVQVGLRGEVVVDDRFGDPGGARDRVHRRGVVAAISEDLHGGLCDPGPPCLGAYPPLEGFISHLTTYRMVGYRLARMSERSLRLVFFGLTAVNFGLAIWLFFFPHSFYTTIGDFGVYNRHYERDVATFYVAFALGALVAARYPSWRVPVLAMTTIQYLTHTINHGIDVSDANNSWAGPFDLATLGLGTIQFAGLLWLLHRRKGAEA